MSVAPLDEQYLRWLYGRTSKKRPQPGATWWKLFRYLFTQEFLWFVPNDDNRIADGCELRFEFVVQKDVVPTEEWMAMGCSVLEMMVALSRRLAFEGEGEPAGWFWILLNNMDLMEMDDERFYEPKVESLVRNLIWRQYNFDGTNGGLFPVEDPIYDQRDIEIWSQMQAWLTENQ